MFAMIGVWAAVSTPVPSPSSPTTEAQKSGPLGLAVILVLCVACYFLFKSMSKHMRKVRESFPAGHTVPDVTAPPAVPQPSVTAQPSVAPATVSSDPDQVAGVPPDAQPPASRPDRP